MHNKEQNFVSAVIYIHNAQERVGDFLKTIIAVLENNFEHSEIICVNDASDDNSLSVIKSIGENAKVTSISVINLSYFHGLEFAMTAGVDMAIGDFVFEFDNTYLDFEKDLIMQVYRHSLEGFDIVSASPDKRSKITSRMFYAVFDQFTDIPYDMRTESFRILSRRVINRIGSMNNTVFYRKPLYANCGLKTDVIPYLTQKDAVSFTDKKEKAYRSGLAVDSLILFTKMGYRFSFMITIIMMMISLFVIGYTIITYFTSSPVAGWTTTVLFLSVSFFGLFGILTIIIKYLQLLVDMVFKKKHYSFESIEKLTKQ